MKAAYLFNALLILSSIAATGCSSASADVERGRRLVEQYQCGTCHVVPGVNGAIGQLAVTLDAFGLRSYIAGRVPNTDKHLVRWIIDPASVVPGTLMPSMGVTPADAADMAAYLRQLR